MTYTHNQELVEEVIRRAKERPNTWAHMQRLAAVLKEQDRTENGTGMAGPE